MAIQTDLSRSIVFAVCFKAIGYYLDDDINNTEIVKIHRRRMYDFCNKFISKLVPSHSTARSIRTTLDSVLRNVFSDVVYSNAD